MDSKTREILDDISMKVAGLIAVMDILEKNNGDNLAEETIANFSWLVTQELKHINLAVNQINRYLPALPTGRAFSFCA